jgi:hypothetical protein
MQNQKSIQAYKVTATVEGKIWLNSATALTANSESEAIAKKRNRLKLLWHSFNSEPQKTLLTPSPNK